MSEANVRQRIVPIHKSILGSINKHLFDEFGIEFPISMQSDWRDVFKLSENDDRQGSYGAMRISELSSDRGDHVGQRQAALANQGIVTGDVSYTLPAEEADRDGVIMGDNPSDVKVSAKVVMNLVPARFRLTLAYMTNDLDEALNFFCYWAFAYEKGRMIYNLDYLGTDISIDLMPVPTMSFPEMNPIGEDSGYGTYEMELEVRGYVSNHSNTDDTKITPIFRRARLVTIPVDSVSSTEIRITDTLTIPGSTSGEVSIQLNNTPLPFSQANFVVKVNGTAYSVTDSEAREANEYTYDYEGGYWIIGLDVVGGEAVEIVYTALYDDELNPNNPREPMLLTSN